MTALDSGQVLGFLLLDLAIILVAARVLGELAKKVGQPSVVGVIVAGVLLGPTLLGPAVFAWDEPWSFLHCDAALAATEGEPSITSCIFPPQTRSVLGLIGQLALVLFMFLVGLELDWDLLKGKGRSIVMVAFGAVAVPMALAFVIGPSLYGKNFVAAFGTADAPSELSFTLFIGAMLSVTAFPVMARILQEKRMTASNMGSVGIAAAAIVTVLMFLAVAVASGVASDQGPSSLATKFVLAGVYIAALFVVARPLLAPLGRRYEQGGLTPGLFSTVLIFTVASAYVAHLIGINVIVGGFLAGAVLPARAGLFRDMAARLSDVTNIVLLPVFLAFSGLNTDFTQLRATHLAGIAVFLVAGVAGKWIGSAASARLSGMSWAEGNVLGILMNCRGLLVLVVALIGVTEGVIAAPMQIGGVLMALVTTIMTGPLFDRFSTTLPGSGAVAATPVPASASHADAYRVVAAFERLDDAPEVLQAAFAALGDHRPAEVVLCRSFTLPPPDDVAPVMNQETFEVERSRRTMGALASFAPTGVEVTPAAFPSTDPLDDVYAVAADRRADLVLVADGLWDIGAGTRREPPARVISFRPGADEVAPTGSQRDVDAWIEGHDVSRRVSRERL